MTELKGVKFVFIGEEYVVDCMFQRGWPEIEAYNQKYTPDRVHYFNIIKGTQPVDLIGFKKAMVQACLGECHRLYMEYRKKNPIQDEDWTY